MTFGIQNPSLFGIVHATLIQSSLKKKKKKCSILLYLGHLGNINWLRNDYNAKWNSQPGNK